MAADQLKVVGQGGNMAVSAPELRLTNEVPFPYTVWKFENSAITQILCEINFGDSRSAKTAVFAILEVVILLFWSIPAFKKCKNSQKSKFRASECGKMGSFALQESSKLISRKI